MILLLVSVVFTIICSFRSEDIIPQFPEFPEFGKNESNAITEMPNVGPTILRNTKAAWTRLRGRSKAINEEIIKIYPLFNNISTQGSQVADRLTEFLGNLTVTQPEDPLNVPKIAKAGYKMVDDLLHDISEAHLKNDGIEAFQKTLESIKDELGLIRCPVALLECMAADVADILGLSDD